MVKEINSNVTRTSGKQPSCFSLPKDVYAIEDDHENGSHASSKVLDISRKSKREIDSM